MGDLELRYEQLSSLWSPNQKSPSVKVRKLARPGRAALVGLALSLGDAFEGSSHHHPLSTRVDPRVGYLLRGLRLDVWRA